MTIVNLLLALLFLQAPQGSIDGVVLNSASEQPIAGARVTLTRAAQPTTAFRTTATGDDGKFSFTGLEPGEYSIATDREGYAIENWMWHLKSLAIGGTAAKVEANRSTAVRIHLTPEAVITGRIVSSTGEPIVNTDVDLGVRIYDSAGQKMYATYAVVSTNDRGEYRFYGLRPGRYYLRAGEPAILRVQPAGLSETNEAPKFKLTYYPGTTELSQAALIDLKVGSTLENINLVLRDEPSKRYRVQGRIVPVDLPANTLQYSFTPVPSEAVTTRRIYTAAADGTFELPDVEPGTYAIQAQMQAPVNRPAPGQPAPLFPTVYGIATVDVVDSNVTGVLVRLRTATLTGRVRLEGETTVPATFQVQLRIPNWNSPQPVGVRHDGTFEFARLSAGVPYNLSILGLFPDMYLKEAKFDGSDVRSQPLRISETSSNVLTIEIGADGASIAGIVRRPNGRPEAGAKVSLLPDDRDRRDLFRFVTAGVDGRFGIRGIAPGGYKAFAFNSTAENFAAFDQDWIQSYEQRGVAVKTQSSGKETVEIPLIPSN